MEKCKVGSEKWEVQIEENLDRLSTTHADRLMTLMTLNFQQFEHVSLMAAWVVPTLVGTTIGVSSFFHGTEWIQTPMNSSDREKGRVAPGITPWGSHRSGRAR